MSDAVRQSPPRRMNVDEFHDWVQQQPSGRYELHGGEVVAQASERVRHVVAKLAAVNALAAAIRAAGLRCTALADGAAVRISHDTAYEPDALVTCAALDYDSPEVPEPVIVVEVISPGSRSGDLTRKLGGYFSLPSVRHYLIVDAEDRVVIHHARRSAERIDTAILREGAAVLDPPGLTLPLAALWPDEPPPAGAA